MVCIFYTFFGKTRVALVLLVAFGAYRLIYNIMKDFFSRTIFKQMKNIVTIIAIIILGILSINVNVSRYPINISLSTDSNNERKLLIGIAINEFKENALIGVGPGNYNNYAQNIMGYSLRNSELSAHNLYLEILAEYGIIGFTLFVIILLPLIVQLFNKNINIYTQFLTLYVIVYYLFSTFADINRLIFAVFIGISTYYINLEKTIVKNGERT